MLKLGIIGTGRMGTSRAKAFNKIDGIKIKWVSSRSRETGEQFAKEFGIDRVLTDWKAGCKDADLDGVIITSPNNLHYEMTVFALNNDKHVLLEYPMAVNTEQSKKIMDEAKSSRGELHLGLTYRLSARHKKIQHLLKELGQIGTCITLMCSGNPISRWFDDKKRLGNVFVGSNIHFFDELIDWFGPVDWVDGSIYEEKRDKKDKNSSQERILRDIGSMMIKFKKGMTAYVSYARGWEKPGLGFNRKIIGERGYIVETGGCLEKWTPAGKEEITIKNTDSIYEDSMIYTELIKDQNYTPLYSPQDGLYAIKVAEAAYNSHIDGKRVYL